MRKGFQRQNFSILKSQRTLHNIFFCICALLLIGGISVSTVIGCAWSFLTEHSVRFSGNTPAEFTRLPPLPINPATRHKATDFLRGQDEDSKYEAAEKREAEMNDLWVRADNAEQQGNFSLSGRLLREYMQRSSAEFDGGLFDTGHPQLHLNSARDRIDALTALSQGANPSAVSAYLAIRREYDQAFIGEDQGQWSENNRIHPQPISFEQLRQNLEQMKPHPALVDNVAYLHAATLYRDGQSGEAIKAFQELITKYRHSEKREAALLMVGRAEVKRFGEVLEQADNEIDRNRQKARDAARHTLQQYLREYPRGQFALDVRGWLARLSLLEGNRASALAEYYRLLAESNDPISRESLLVSIRLTRHQATNNEMRQVEDELADEPAAALTYAYHSLYNYLPSALFDLYYDAVEDDNASEQEKQARSKKIDREEKERIVAFATRLLQRFPRTAIGGGFALRLAEAQLEMGDAAAALRSSVRALELGVKGRDRTEALWVKGSSEFHLQNYAAVRRTFKQLISEFPNSDLAEGAGRLITMAAEDAGDLDCALEQYIALGYEDDIAYFIDVLMTPEQLARFIARHASSPRLNELNYALAVRYLRCHQWTEARSALSRVKVTEQDSDVSEYYNEKPGDPVEFRSSARTAKTPSGGTGIAARWLWRDLKTIEDLDRLEREAAAAHDDEAKAEALYQFASYFYQSSTFLFYNPNLWDGSRHYKLEEMDSYNSYRAPGEAQLLLKSMQEHEPVVHALEIYLDVVHRFPQTRAARDALFTAAVCHKRLSDYNGYWRNIYGLGMHAGTKMVSYQDVRRAYPNYQLPRGTIGWEPVTRTVNGGLGWDIPPKPPKPAPKPTRRARIKKWLADSFIETRQKAHTAGEWLRLTLESIIRGMVYSMIAVILLAACYFTSMGLYIRNQTPSHTSLSLEKPSLSQSPDHLMSSNDSPVEKLINDP